MKPLIFATSLRPSNADEEIKQGRRSRIDYMELANRLNGAYMDYNSPGMEGGTAHRLEDKIRQDFYRATKVASLAKRNHHDVVLSMSERMGLPLAYSLDRKIKHVAMLHNPFSPVKMRLLQTLNTAKRWDTILAFSQAEAELLRRTLKLPVTRVDVLLLAIDTNFFKPDEVVINEGDPDFILTSGLAGRDYPTLIKALRKLPQVTCYLSAKSAWVSHKGGFEDETIPDNVHIKPLDNQQQIKQAYTKCRFVVLPIRPNHPQISVGLSTLLQVGSMGKALIATRMGPYADYVIDGETGLLIEGDNPAALAEAIEYLWENPQKAQEMGQRARQHIQSEFSLDRWLEKMSAILQATVDRG